MSNRWGSPTSRVDVHEESLVALEQGDHAGDLLPVGVRWCQGRLALQQGVPRTGVDLVVFLNHGGVLRAPGVVIAVSLGQAAEQ